MNELVVLNDKAVPVTTSLKVAEKFGKRHDNVIRSIETIQTTLKSQGMTLLNFEEAPYVHPQNKQTHNMYIMDRDAFSVLVFGFTGPEALKFKVDYVKAFNTLELEVMKKQSDLLDISGDPVTIMQTLLNKFQGKEPSTEPAPVAPAAKPVDPYDRILNEMGQVCMRVGFRKLGLAPYDTMQWCQKNKYLWKDGCDKYQPNSWTIAAGYFERRIRANGRISGQTMLTRKGLIEFMRLKDAHELPVDLIRRVGFNL